jgi:hypothetical protein
MKFLELHERLRLETWRRIDQGILSSSLLARQTGLAQAHISNFLHRRRRLSLSALDSVLLAEDISVEDLAPLRPSAPVRLEGTTRESMDVVPLVSQTAAMTAPIIDSRRILGSVHLPSGPLTRFPPRRAMSRRSWERFVGVRVTASQALPMDPILRIGSIVVIDRHYNSLVTCRPPTPNLYAVRFASQMLFRHAAFEASRLVLRPRALDYPIDIIELTPQEVPSDLLVGRVCLSISEI